MTAPDHTPHLLPTDLRTAEDAARWLSMQGNYSALMLASFLRDHLDRERRQACERGWWAQARLAQTRGRWASEARSVGHTEWAALRESERAHHMKLALAFRAAARS